MENRYACFLPHLTTVSDLLDKAKKEKNSAYWLFQQNLRTPVFQLEALSRIYAHAYDKKFFKKLLKRSKALEDALGTLDYYVAFEQSIKPVKHIPTEIKLYAQERIAASTDIVHEVLLEDGWLNGKRLRKIMGKLQDMEWLSEEEEQHQFLAFYEEEIQEIVDFLSDLKHTFKDPENDLHEFRRKLRWLGIYAQALNGKVQLKKVQVIPANLKKYANKAIVQSPYNQLPSPGKQQHLLYLNQYPFYALSWLIQELGVLKDQSLITDALHEASKATGIAIDAKKLKNTPLAAFEQQAVYLEKAQKLTQSFLKDQVLQHLVVRK